MSVYPRNKLSEAIGIFCFAVSLMLFISLIGYHPLDPSLSVSAPVDQYQNYIGKIGSWVSDFLYQLFGFGALFIPIPILLLGYAKFRGRKIDLFFIKLICFLCMLLSLSSGIELLDLSIPEGVNFTLGGIVGIVIGRFLLGYLNQVGALLAVLTILLLSAVLATRFSLEASIRWIRQRASSIHLNPFTSIRRRLAGRKARRKVARLAKSDQAIMSRQMPEKITLEEDELQDTAREPADPTVVAHGIEESSESIRLLEPLYHAEYRLPSLDFLIEPESQNVYDQEELIQRARRLEMKCAEFDVLGKIQQIQPGPVVTTFEFKPDPGIKYSRIVNLSDDLCLALKAISIRIDRIPGKNTIGIEVPNPVRRTIRLREILSSPPYVESRSPLTLGIGQMINGKTFVVDLTRMPHLLLAGATGSGKSVGLNAMICSILYKAGPEEVRFIMVDPKRLELGLYSDIPHLLTPIVTDPKKAANALNWAVREMEERYRVLARHSVRNIAQFNRLAKESAEIDDELEPLPYIVIIVDELADLMMTSGKETESALIRLAQMARAVGIHLILATQRPSVDVLTGLIKSNFPSRISFRVSSRVDSKIILDTQGADQLLGLGDMLFLSPTTSRLTRVHGALIEGEEVTRIVEFLKEQAEPEFKEEILETTPDESETALLDFGEVEDKLFDEAARFIVEHRKASTSLLQRRFRIGYGRAARLLDVLEHEGIVGPSVGSKAREVLVPPDYFHEIDNQLQ